MRRAFYSPLLRGPETRSTLLTLQFLHHLCLVNLNDKGVVILADDGAHRVYVGQQAGRFVGWGRQQDLELAVHHKLQGAGCAGSVHFAERLVEQGQADGVRRTRLVEAIRLGERGGHGDVEGGRGLATRLFGLDLAEQHGGRFW